jgi:hypothetical protein
MFPVTLVVTVIKHRGINLVALRQRLGTRMFLTVMTRQQRDFVPLKIATFLSKPAPAIDFVSKNSCFGSILAEK